MNNARAPQVSVFVNGTILPGVLDIGIEANNHLCAGRYRISAALGAVGAGFWEGNTFTVEVRGGVAGEWSQLAYGDVDRLDFDIGRGEVCLEGRDLTSRFVEARTQESFENQTASEIAATLAARRGLTGNITPTDIIAGRNYQSDQSRTTLDQHARWTTEWDLLVQLAELVGYDVWVEGQTLNFCPPDQSSNTVYLTPQDCRALNLHRLLNLESGLRVVVKSWDCRGQRSIIQTAATSQQSASPREYVVVRANLTGDAAQGMAERLLSQMSQHRRGVSLEMPGDITTRPRDLLSLADTSTDFDGVWEITSVTRQMSFERGFVQTVEARVPAWTTF